MDWLVLITPAATVLIALMGAAIFFERRITRVETKVDFLIRAERDRTNLGRR